MVLYLNKKRVSKQFLIFGIIWTLYGSFLTINSYLESNFKWHEFAFVIIGLCYLFMYFWNIFMGYVTLEDTFIKKNDVFGRKVMLKDITGYKKFAGEYRFKNSGKDLVIAPDSLDENSKEKFFEYLEKLQIPII